MKFHEATGAGSSITHSAIHTGNSIGVYFDRSAQITFDDNVVVDFVEHGVLARGSYILELTNNWVIYVRPPGQYFDASPKMFEYEGWTGCWTLSDTEGIGNA